MTARRIAPALAVLLLTCAPRVSRSDEFSDFRIPTNRVLLWTGSVNGSARWQGNTSSNGHSEDGSQYSALGSELFYRRESDTRLRDFSVRVSGGGDRYHQATRSLTVYQGAESREGIDQDLSGSMSMRDLEQWYPDSSPVSFLGEISVSVVDSRRWASSHLLVTDTTGYYYEHFDATNEWRYSNLVMGSLGIGVGRVRNATGLYEALVFERRLLDSGAISRSLGAQAKRELAALFYARSDYTRTMDRPAATVWAAIEGILQRDGALAGSPVDARRLFEASEAFIGSRGFTGPDALPSSPVLRLHGCAVRLTATGRTGQWIRRAGSSSSNVYSRGVAPIVSRTFERVALPTDVAGIGIAGELHRPAGPRWQLDASLGAEVPVTSRKRGFDERFILSATFIVTNRWLARVSLAHQRLLDREGASGFTTTDRWSVTNSAALEYWLSDHVDLSLGALQGWGHYRSDQYASTGSGNRGQFGRVNFGLGYRFAGFAEIPGITNPIP